MWIFGGNTGMSTHELWFAEVPSPAFNEFALTTSPSRFLHTAVLAPSGRMWLFGGEDGGLHNDLWYLDTEAGTTDFVLSSPSGTPPTAGFQRHHPKPAVKRHSAVLSSVGNMWVFGGDTSSGVVNNLHKIDVEVSPTSPTWTEVYPSGYIEPRRDHTAVLTLSDRMWIFAGVEQSTNRRNDLVYIDLEAVSPSWVTASTTGSLPRGRGLPKSVLNKTSNRMWMFGGYSSNTFENDLWYIDLQDTGSLTWNEVNPTVKPPPRVDVAGELSSDGRFWIHGGNGGSTLDDLWVIQVTAPEWELTWLPVDPVTVNGSPGARKLHSTVINPAGDMLMYGGADTSAFSDMWILSPVAPATTTLDAEWSAVSATDTPEGRVYSSAVMSSDGRMWLLHGYWDDFGATSLREVFYIDTQVDAGSHDWTQVSEPGPSLPTARNGHSTILTESGRLYVYGGTDSPGSTSAYSDLWYFDTEASSVQAEWFQETVSGAEARCYFGAVYSSGRMYLFGGQDGGGTLKNDLGYIDMTMSGSFWWSSMFPTGTLPSVRYKHSTVMNSARRMWIYGGEADTTGTAFLNDLWYIDVEDSSDSWHQVSVSGTAPTARSEHAAVLSATGRMWIYGGIGASGILSDVWYIDVEVGSPSWVQMIASGSNPGPRRAHSAALTADNEMWIFSGYFVEGGVDDELWYLEARVLASFQEAYQDTETESVSAASPAWVSAGEWTNARYDHASGITASGRAVVFGGYSGSSGLLARPGFLQGSGPMPVTTTLLG
ncbi:Leucine-zipper-like transcriptional regulator 1 [Symbiodinium microadriaticum]|uniref:Leucine-zipper-like transcriptional regulator 1 n=1 Tax=Symbiodinium microadriaticum TaxID=2951 RepID=A0A1Q9F5M1_SYMMI|nr:Leucine-zipper-like transcriptional regulator 1 [Symbiodinium microadriaticum]